MEQVLVLIVRANLEAFWNRKEMANKDNIAITICSDLDYECLIAEIIINGKFVGLLTNEPNKEVCFEIPDDQTSCAGVKLDVLENALKQAKQELLNAEE
jgi:hypothetical protein